MSSNQFFGTNSNRGVKTNKLSKFLLVLFLVIIPMGVFWLLFGQFNLAEQNWLVSLGGRFYQNKPIIEALKATGIPEGSSVLQEGFVKFWLFSKDSTLPPHYIEALAKFGYKPYKPIFDPLILAPTMGLLLLDIVIFVLLSLFSKNIYIDVFPMAISSWLGMFILIITGIIPEGGEWLPSGAKIPIIIVCIIIAWVGSMILLNLLFNKLIIESKYSDIYYEKLLRETREENLAKKEIDSKKYKKESDESTVVEVVE